MSCPTSRRDHRSAAIRKYIPRLLRHQKPRWTHDHTIGLRAAAAVAGKTDTVTDFAIAWDVATMGRTQGAARCRGVPSRGYRDAGPKAESSGAGRRPWRGGGGWQGKSSRSRPAMVALRRKRSRVKVGVLRLGIDMAMRRACGLLPYMIPTEGRWGFSRRATFSTMSWPMVEAERSGRWSCAHISTGLGSVAGSLATSRHHTCHTYIYV